ncbi:MAG TPA: hypothetical protein ENF34_00675 [Candidatus Bathyarchaeota archaeon]|nr:hypothetical protein [Candidatus Bathyarchaeota archaeon]
MAPVISRPSAPQVERPGAEVRPAERPVSEARAPPAPSPPTPTPAPKPAEEAPGEARAEVRREIPREARAGFTEDELSRILRILRERRRRP